MLKVIGIFFAIIAISVAYFAAQVAFTQSHAEGPWCTVVDPTAGKSYCVPLEAEPGPPAGNGAGWR